MKYFKARRCVWPQNKEVQVRLTSPCSASSTTYSSPTSVCVWYFHITWSSTDSVWKRREMNYYNLQFVIFFRIFVFKPQLASAFLATVVFYCNQGNSNSPCRNFRYMLRCIIWPITEHQRTCCLDDLMYIRCDNNVLCQKCQRILKVRWLLYAHLSYSSTREY